MDSYRPLCILNNDYKILAKVLALHLEKVVPSLIHLDHVGFIPGRLSANNMRRLLHVITAANQLDAPVIAASLDAMKAFDRTEWPFLLATLSRFNFGSQFIHWVKALYDTQVSSVKTNGLKSALFNRHCGVHQGCPVFIICPRPGATSLCYTR